MSIAVVFTADSFPRRLLLPRLTFRFDKGVIGLSKGLYELLQLEDKQRVFFVTYKKGWYIARIDEGGFWVNATKQSSYTINNKPFTQQFLRELGYGSGEVVRVPVATHQVLAAELDLLPSEHPYPFYRLAIEPQPLK